MYTPRVLATKSWSQPRRELERIYRERGPCDVVMADIDDNIPGQRVAFFAQAALETAR